MSTRLTTNKAMRARRTKIRLIATTVLAALFAGLGVVSSAQAAVTVSGSFSGYSVADIKAYSFQSAPITMSMTTQTAITTNTDTVLELLSGGGAGTFSYWTSNSPFGAANDCSGGCLIGDPKLSGLTVSITDPSNNVDVLADSSIKIFDTLIAVSFDGSSIRTIPSGSTIKFEFASSRINGNPSTTHTIRTRDTNNNVVIDTTAAYDWFKRVVFQGNGGSTSNLAFEGKDFVLSTAVSPSTTLPSSVYRAGYTFTGWNTVAGGTGTAYAPGATFTFPAQTTNLYAQWAVAPKVVTFNVNGGTGSLAQQSSAVAVALTSNNNNITRSGYTFNGWNTVAGGTGTAYANGATFPFTANTTLYAQWVVAARTVTFDANGGTGALAAQSSATAANLTSNGNSITKAGYTFTGWNTVANGSGTAYANAASFPFTSNTTLFAQWSANTNAVIYDSHGGSAVADGSFVTGGAVTSLAAAPTRTGYIFNGWFASASGGSALTNGYAPGATAAITLHAQWSGATNTVAYDSHGGSAVADGSFVTGGSIATLATAPTRSGYTFAGWFAAANGGSALADGYAPGATTAITLHAQWTANTNTITYDSHGGSPVADGSFVTGGSIATLPAAPTLAGYVFQGWFLAANGGTALANGYSPSATVAITLHAQWAVAAYTVTFDSNGGAGSMNPQSGLSAANLTLNSFTQSGFYFDGWNTQANGSGTDYENSASFPFTSSVTLYAQWRAIPAAPTATAVIQVPIGSSIDNAPVALSADGLLDQSGYEVTVFSTPQVIDRGTIWSGRLNTTVRIPAGLESGWHRLVITGTAADGTPWVETNYFEVSPTGLLLDTRETAPAGYLVNTGTNAPSVAPVAVLFVLIGAGFVGMNVWMRRRKKF